VAGQGGALPAGPPSRAGSCCPRYSSADASPAWTGPGHPRTACSSPHAAACPCQRCCPPRQPCPRPGTAPSGARRPRIRRPAGRAPRTRPARPARPASAITGPGPRATPDPGRRTMRASSPGYEAYSRHPVEVQPDNG
jgi:hypothetical protein